MAERDCGGVMAKRSYHSKHFNFLFKGRIIFFNRDRRLV